MGKGGRALVGRLECGPGQRGWRPGRGWERVGGQEILGVAGRRGRDLMPMRMEGGEEPKHDPGFWLVEWVAGGVIYGGGPRRPRLEEESQLPTVATLGSRRPLDLQGV